MSTEALMASQRPMGVVANNSVWLRVDVIYSLVVWIERRVLCPSGHTCLEFTREELFFVTVAAPLFVKWTDVVNTSGEVPLSWMDIGHLPNRCVAQCWCLRHHSYTLQDDLLFAMGIRIRNIECDWSDSVTRTNIYLASFFGLLFQFVPQLDMKTELSDGLKFLNFTEGLFYPSNAERVIEWLTSSSYSD